MGSPELPNREEYPQGPLMKDQWVVQLWKYHAPPPEPQPQTQFIVGPFDSAEEAGMWMLTHNIGESMGGVEFMFTPSGWDDCWENELPLREPE